MVDSSRHAIYLSVPRKATIACASDSERPRFSIAVSVLKDAGLDLFLQDEDNALSVVGDVEVAILVFADTCDLERSIVEECALPDIANPP